MDRALSHQEERESTQRCHKHLKICLHVLKPRNPPKSFAFSVSTFRVPKSLRNLCSRAKCSNGFCFARLQFTGMVVNNAVYCASPCFLMEGGSEGMGDGFGGNGREIEEFGGAIHEEHRESSSSSDFLASSEATVNEEACSSYGDSSSSPSTAMAMAWSIRKNDAPHVDKRKLEKQGSFSSCLSEVEMMKERFSKLLLGEDMSGCGNGVCTALAISNAITNLCATLFGQIWRLEPLPPEKKTMWRREMDMLLCVSDHIVELTPTWQTFPDGSKLEVMTCRPRSDLYVNLPALRKLDNMLLEILDGFENMEFWYVDQGIQAPEKEGSCSFRQPFPRQEEKWWLPVPRVPNGGLSESSRKHLQYKRDSTNQILKAALAINSIALADMAVPDSYLESLPKNGRASLGDLIHRYITSEQFSPECLLDCLDLSSEHQALEIANRVEASIFVWRRRTGSKSTNSTGRSNSRSSWEMVKDLVIDGDKREVLADRAETLLLSLKQKFPGLPQTTLDMSKIQYNKDVGKSILESYSRVLESLAFNIVARIDDLFYVDDLTRHSDQFLSLANLGSTKFSPIPLSGTPYKTAFATPSFSPSITTNLIISPKTGERSSTLSENLKLNHHGFGVKKVLTDYLSIDSKGKGHFKRIERSDSLLSTTGEASTSECSDEGLSPETYDLIVK